MELFQLVALITLLVRLHSAAMDFQLITTATVFRRRGDAMVKTIAPIRVMSLIVQLVALTNFGENFKLLFKLCLVYLEFHFKLQYGRVHREEFRLRRNDKLR